MDDYLRGRLKRALDELSGLDPDIILSENADVLVSTLIAKHVPTAIEIDWGSPIRTPITEVETQIQDHFFEGRTYTVPSSRVVISFPISGSAEMLDYRASTFSISGNYGKISRGQVEVEIAERTLDAETIRAHIDRVRQNVQARATWANDDLAKFMPAAGQSVRDAFTARKERILNDRQLEDALGIPVRTSSSPRPPVPAQRALVALLTRKGQAGFVPEPVLDDAIYQDVLHAVRGWATSLERTPGTAAKLDEEELRDLLLGTLNSYWQGAAGGELFNGSGKTDILIRHDNRNAFVAECKIWRGPKGVADALDQLLSYLVWRDSKAALIMFIKTKDPASAIERLHNAVASHPRHVLTKETPDPSARVDYVFTADEEQRRVSLAVIPVVLRAAVSSADHHNPARTRRG